MDFEFTMRLFFGDRAYGIAGTEGSPKLRSQWLRRVLGQMAKVAESIETTERHRQMVLGELQAIHDGLKPSETPRWSLVYAMIRLIGRLLGYDFVRAARCHTPVYWQSSGQYLNSVVFEGGDVMQNYYDQKNAAAIRRQVVESMHGQGLTDYVIAQVLNTTEYQVKKLRREDPLPSAATSA